MVIKGDVKAAPNVKGKGRTNRAQANNRSSTPHVDIAEMVATSIQPQVSSKTSNESKEDTSRVLAGQSEEITRQEMFVYAILGLVAVVSFLIFVTFPSGPVGVLGIVAIVCTKTMLVRVFTGKPLIPFTGRAVLVTSCSNDRTSELVASLQTSWNKSVIIACYKTDSANIVQPTVKFNQQLHTIYINTKCAGSIHGAVQHVKDITKDNGLWCLLNAGGGGYSLGDIELTSGRDLETITSDLLDTVLITQAFLPLVRKASGRLVMVQTNHGSLNEPFSGALNIRESSMSALSQTLRIELRRFGVQQSTIEAYADVTTGGCDCNTEKGLRDITAISDEVQQDYGEDYIQFMATRRAEPLLVSKKDILDSITEAVWSITPRPVYRINKGSVTSFVQRYPALSHLLPTWFVDQLVMFSYKNSPLPTAAPEPEDDD